ncbi:MAG: triple tyrosine motif-containing protein, partial [Chitinophagaceae bacterium]
FGSGLYKMNNRTLSISEVKNFASSEAIDRMYKVGGNLVIQMLDYSAYVTDYGFNVKTSAMLPEDFRISVLKDKIYQVSNFGQVDLLDNNLKVVKKNLFPEVSSRITEIICHRDHFLIATFGQGLYVYDQWGKMIKKLDKRNGLNTNIVTSLLVDGSHLFLGTNLGLVRAGLPDFSAIKVFNEDEGMFNWECRQDGLKKLANGGIMVSTTNGPYIYYPAKDMTGQYTAATLTIADFSYGGNTKEHLSFSAVSANIQLPEIIAYKNNDVTITLQGISQRNPDDIIYHYQLQGYDSMWISTANPVVKFSNLDPGDYRLRAYATTGDYTSKQVSVKFSVDKPLSGKLWFQALLVLLLSFICWLLLTVGNRIYQKYIQTKMVGKLEADVALKQNLTAQSVSFSQDNYMELCESLKSGSHEKHLESLTPLFLTDINKRIQLLWKKDTIALSELHAYFDELLAEYEPGAKIYHKISANDMDISMPVGFHLLQIFSLYLFIGLYENGSPVFSLDSENKSNGHLLFRFYRLNHAANTDKTCTYHFLKDAIERQKPQGVTIDVIENLEFGNMIIAELNMHNKN